MKTVIEYSDSEDDKMALKRVMKSMDMTSLLFEIQKNMKKRVDVALLVSAVPNRFPEDIYMNPRYRCITVATVKGAE